MNDFASTQNSSGLLKSYYDPGDAQIEALKRRQKRLEFKVSTDNPNPKPPEKEDPANDTYR